MTDLGLSEYNGWCIGLDHEFNWIKLGIHRIKLGIHRIKLKVLWD